MAVQPFVDETLTIGRLDGRNRGSCEGLQFIYMKSIEFITKRLGSILSLSMCHGDKKSSIDILGNSIWKVFHEALSAKLSDIFKTSQPDRFYSVCSFIIVHSKFMLPL